MDSGNERKRVAENRAFTRLVGRLDKDSISLLLRLARAMERGDGNADHRLELERVIVAVSEALLRRGSGNSGRR